MKSTMEINGWLKTKLEPLRKKMGSINVVGAAGPPDARLMIIGEAPGKNEDEQDMPFVGRSGDLLNKMLKEAGLDRSRIYITNTVKCRPMTPNKKANRPPTDEEVVACKRCLWEEMKIVRPVIIITLGLIPAKLCLKGSHKMTMASVVGRLWPVCFDNDTDGVLPIWHPSFLLRSKREYTEKAIGYLKKVKALLDKGGPLLDKEDYFD